MSTARREAQKGRSSGRERQHWFKRREREDSAPRGGAEASEEFVFTPFITACVFVPNPSSTGAQSRLTGKLQEPDTVDQVRGRK